MEPLQAFTVVKNILQIPVLRHDTILLPRLAETYTLLQYAATAQSSRNKARRLSFFFPPRFMATQKYLKSVSNFTRTRSVVCTDAHNRGLAQIAIHS